MKTKILILALAILLSSCLTNQRKGNNAYLVCRYDRPIESAKTPYGFVVTPQEIQKLIPDRKYGYNIYADLNNYYISSAIQKFSKTGDNAALAKQNGLRISGKDRKEFEDRLNGKRTPTQKMEDALRH